VPGGGSLRWLNTVTGDVVASAKFSRSGSNDHRVFTLHYRVTIGDTKHDVDLPITLDYTEPYFGGKRWWFRCPLVVGGIRCWQRVGKLYLPPRGKYYGCRRCYNLTYQSSNDSHQFDGFFRSLAGQLRWTPETLKRVLSSAGTW
jgi:hypothetical protein